MTKHTTYLQKFTYTDSGLVEVLTWPTTVINNMRTISRRAFLSPQNTVRVSTLESFGYLK